MKQLSPSGHKNPSKWKSLACWGMFSLSFALLYHHTLGDLAQDWWTNPDDSYGLVVPFAAVWILYSRYSSFKSTKVAPMALGGMIWVTMSQVMFLAGCLGAESFLQEISIPLLAVGVILCLWGFAHLRLAMDVLGLFCICIPLPAIIMHQITMPLQLIASAGSEAVLLALDIPVYRDGNILHLARQTLSVADACSGIHSLMALFALAVIMSAVFGMGRTVRIMFVTSAVGVAIFANVLRISMVAVIGSEINPRFTVGMWHQAEGWVVFTVSLLILGLELHFIDRMSVKRGKTV